MAKVIVFGNTKVSELMHFYLTHDAGHEVVAFTVNESHIKDSLFCEKPVVPFETIEIIYSPDCYEMCIFLGFTDVNELRETKFLEAKQKGYKMISYISSKAVVWPGASIGENCYIFEQAIIMPFSVIGNNVVILPGCMIGHHSNISDHCFLASHSVVLGLVRIGKYCILGANSTIKDLVEVADRCIIGAGAEIMKNTKYGEVYVGNRPQLLNKSSNELKKWVTWYNSSRNR